MVSICGKIIPGLAVFSNHFYNFAFGLFWLFFFIFFDCFVNHFGLGDSSQKEAEPLFSCCREADLFAGLDLWLWMPGKKFRWAQGESPMSVLSDSMRQPICCPLCGWYTIYIYISWLFCRGGSSSIPTMHHGMEHICTTICKYGISETPVTWIHHVVLDINICDKYVLCIANLNHFQPEVMQM